MNLAIKPHFSQNISLHLTQTQYDWPMREGLDGGSGIHYSLKN